MDGVSPLIRCAQTDFVIHKVLAHATHNDVKEGKMSAWERLGNHVADKHAGDAAELYAIDSRLLDKLDDGYRSFQASSEACRHQP